MLWLNDAPTDSAVTGKEPWLVALEQTLGQLRHVSYRRGTQWFDWIVALLLLLATSPLIALAAVLVKLTSRGPAFYSQIRLGHEGVAYTLYKIRTMVHNCERETGPRWATRADPRIIPLGHLLRALHVDELPQLWNVLRGEMSLVGPRPERPEFVAQLEPVIPCYRSRLLVRPGLTGLAQLQLPPDSDLDSVRRKLAYDLYYVHRQSLSLDLRILASTGCYLLRVPFRITHRLLQVPSGKFVEWFYESLEAHAPPLLEAPPSQS
jgi:lipopolysaccharide/colanic/teichoic acid biosynthesis glycosyltransferase